MGRVLTNNTVLTNRTGFLDLPSELRERIYDAYFSMQPRAFTKPNQVLMTVSFFPSAALHRICRQIYQEIQQHISFRSRLQIFTRYIPDPQAPITLPLSVQSIRTVEVTRHYGAVPSGSTFCFATHDYTREIDATLSLIQSLLNAMDQLRSITLTIMLPPSQRAFEIVRASKLFCHGVGQVKRVEVCLGAFGHPCRMEDQNRVVAVWENSTYSETDGLQSAQPLSTLGRPGPGGKTLSA